LPPSNGRQMAISRSIWRSGDRARCRTHAVAAGVRRARLRLETATLLRLTSLCKTGIFLKILTEPI
jgi:hypothetical protein